MHKGQQPLLWVLLTIAVLLGGIWQFYPLPDAKQRLYQLPISGPGFSGTDVPITPIEDSIFNNVNIIKRIYEVGGQRSFIYVLDGTRNRHAVHDPTYCFRGGGWEIVSKKDMNIPGGTAVLYQLFKKETGEKREALLWFSDGKSHYASPMRYWLEATLRRLTLGYSGPEPVLIVIQPVTTSSLDWQKLLEDFPDLLKI